MSQQECPNCGYQNRPGVVFCENCGTSLMGQAASASTKSLTEEEAKKASVDDATGKAAKIDEGALESHSDEFPEGGTLQLEIGEGTKPIVLKMDKAVRFGRRDASTGSIPDVDLTPYAGYRMGVSRQHAEIRPDDDTKYLNMWDLGSSNGSFINGDRLISHRPYRLRDTDQIRFGQLVVRVRFLKPSESTDSSQPATSDKTDELGKPDAPKKTDDSSKTDQPNKPTP